MLDQAEVQVAALFEAKNESPKPLQPRTLIEYCLSSEMTRRHPTLLGYLTVKDMFELTKTASSVKALIIAKKLIKKIVRFGNLDAPLRKFFWRKLCDYSKLEEAL